MSKNANTNGSTIGFDLEDTDVGELEERGTTVHIKDKTGDEMYVPGTETPVTITVVGTLSPTYRRLANKHRDNAVKRMRSSSAFSSEQNDKDELQIIVGCVKGWQGFGANGVEIPPSREALVKLFTKFPFVLKQVQEEMDRRANFSERSSASSASP